ncbi:uncharacterized protein [Argopecten irradians]|uniref:uncharacterized protein isoform X1 n=2 Tax=Argopecten irradians TaxID=31199 RepID=UPI00371262B6
MDIKILLIFMVILCAAQQGPVAYRGFTCVEPEVGYMERMINYFVARKVEKTCPTHGALLLRIGNEVFCTVLCAITSLILVYTYMYALLVGNHARKFWKAIGVMFREWRARRSLCRFCGTDPCQARRTSWRRHEARMLNHMVDFEKRSHAMWMFSLGLELSATLTKELPRDEKYWARKYCADFQEEHMALFPLCVQRQINAWYPLPR